MKEPGINQSIKLLWKGKHKTRKEKGNVGNLTLTVELSDWKQWTRSNRAETERTNLVLAFFYRNSNLIEMFAKKKKKPQQHPYNIYHVYVSSTVLFLILSQLKYSANNNKPMHFCFHNYLQGCTHAIICTVHHICTST